MVYIPQTALDAFKGRSNLGLFFRLDTVEPLRLWWGVNKIPARITDLDAAGTRYQGAGWLVEVPSALEIMINGGSERVEWRLSGIPAELLVNMAESTPPVVGKRCSFGIAPLSESWQMVGDIIELWTGTGDYWSEEQPFQPNPGAPKLRNLMLSTGSGDTSRSLGHLLMWTDRAQKQISSTDLFCERVTRFFPGYQIAWPRF